MKNNSAWRSEVVALWNTLSRLKREDVAAFNIAKYMPPFEPQHAKIPALGWVGRRYRPGGLLMIAANPGGGGPGTVDGPEEANLYRLFAALGLTTGDISAAFEAMSDEYLKRSKTYPLWKVMAEVIRHTSLAIDEAAFVNALPFRTAKDWVTKPILAEFYQKALGRQIDILAPARIVFLGRKAETAYRDNARTHDISTYYLPRLVGDSNVSDDAWPELRRLAGDARVSV